MQILLASYPNFHPNDMKATLEVWEMMLDKYEDAQVALAIKAYILSNSGGFPPTIGQVVAMIHKNPNELTELAAWGLVERAIRNGTYGAETEFAKLPQPVQEALGGPGQLREWAAMDESALPVAQSNFLRSYRSALQRERERQTMPPELARLYERAEPRFMALPEKEEIREEGVPMPEELKRKLRQLM